jgi:hypothetical protein
VYVCTGVNAIDKKKLFKSTYSEKGFTKYTVLQYDATCILHTYSVYKFTYAYII